VYRRAANGANQVCSQGHCHYQRSLHKIGAHVLVKRPADNQPRSTQSRHDLTEQTNETSRNPLSAKTSPMQDALEESRDGQPVKRRTTCDRKQ
jgi:hypothetical protein